MHFYFSAFLLGILCILCILYSVQNFAGQHTRCCVQAEVEAGGALRHEHFQHCFGDDILLLRMHSSKTARIRSLPRCGVSGGEEFDETPVLSSCCLPHKGWARGGGVQRTAGRTSEVFDVSPVTSCCWRSTQGRARAERAEEECHAGPSEWRRRAMQVGPSGGGVQSRVVEKEFKAGPSEPKRSSRPNERRRRSRPSNR